MCMSVKLFKKACMANTENSDTQNKIGFAESCNRVVGILIAWSLRHTDLF